MKVHKMAVLSLTVALALAGALALLWRLDATSHIAHADPDIRWASNNCTGFPQPSCYTSIQAAVNAAGDGDVIRVTQGAYSETVVVTKSVTLEGGWRKDTLARDWDIYTTTIDAHRAGSVVHVQEPYGKSLSSTIEGFILTGGDASAYLGWGGGILIDGNWEGSGMAIIRHNVITNNVACNNSSCQGYGGGIMVYSSQSDIEYNTVVSNAARTGGNGSGQGGGITVWGWPANSTIAHNVILSNTAIFSPTGLYSNGEGGGVWSDYDAVLLDNEIGGNVAAVKGEGRGGGVYAGGSLYDNRILSNTASISGTGYGGGVYAEYVIGFDSNLVQGNLASKGGDGTGGGIWALYLQRAWHNEIVGNAATRGGGVYYSEYTGNQEFGDNLVALNWATGTNIGTWDGGGGIASQADWVEITGNDILTNAALMGGGMLVTGGDRYLAQDNLIQGNWAVAGGGLYVYTATGAIVQNQVASNAAIWWGGGMYLFQASPTMDGNIVVSNTAGGAGAFAGGGLILDVGAGTRVTLTNHIIARNTVLTATAGGVHCMSGSCALIHCTIVDNKLGSAPGEGVRMGAMGGANVLWNSIIVGHSTGVVISSGVTALLDYNDYFENTIPVSGALAGVHSLANDPQFQNRAAGDYHLAETSPLINIGDGSVSAPHDFEGDPRPIGSRPDVGADEYVHAKLYLPVIMKNYSAEGPG